MMMSFTGAFQVGFLELQVSKISDHHKSYFLLRRMFDLLQFLFFCLITQHFQSVSVLSSLSFQPSPVLATVVELGCSDHLLIQMNSVCSNEQLQGVWAPGPGPQLLSQLHSQSAECEYSLNWPDNHRLTDVCVAASGVYMGAEGPIQAHEVQFIASKQCNMFLGYVSYELYIIVSYTLFQ